MKPATYIRHFLVGFSILTLFSPLLLAADGTVRITATHVKADSGSVVFSVYDNSDTWLGDGWRTRKVIPVVGHRIDDSVTVELLLPPGEYAVSVFLDLDGDEKLARNFFGIPTEPAGLSNNVRPRFGPPRFKDAKFTVGNTLVEQSIELRE
jgi:uncharacterized protein (DUF2141 family)